MFEAPEQASERVRQKAEALLTLLTAGNFVAVGIAPLPVAVGIAPLQAAASFPRPETASYLLDFLEIVDYYHVDPNKIEVTYE